MQELSAAPVIPIPLCYKGRFAPSFQVLPCESS